MKVFRGTTEIKKIYLGSSVIHEVVEQVVNPNLLNNSQGLSDYTIEDYARMSMTEKTDSSGVYEEYSFAGNGDIYWYLELNANLTKGKDYTFSIDVKADRETIAFHWMDDVVREFNIPYNGGRWQRFSYTHNQNTNTTERKKLFGIEAHSGMKIGFRKAKLEEGKAATGWAG